MRESQLTKFLKFFRENLWNIPTDPAKPIRSFFIQASRIVVAATHGFTTDECFLKASALCYYSLLSIVPILAVFFGIAKGFGFEQRLEDEIIYQFREYPEIANKVILFAYNMLANTQGSVIAGVGVVVLFYTVFKVLSTVENTLNDIWKVTEDRSIGRKLTDYLATMLMAPVFFAASSSFTIYVTRELVKASRSTGYFEYASPFITFLFYFLPYVFAWALFTFVYLFLPNTKVNWKSAIIAGILAGSVFQLLQWAYITFQVNVTSYSAIYGSFAALPLFLIWLNLSWIILLAGAEIAYHSEYDYQAAGHAYTGESQRSLTSEKAIAIVLLNKILSNLTEGQPPLTFIEISREMKMNMKITREVAENLVKCGVLEKTTNSKNEDIYLPALPAEKITLQSVCSFLDDYNAKSYFIYENEELRRVNTLLDKLKRKVDALSENIPLSSPLKK